MFRSSNHIQRMVMTARVSSAWITMFAFGILIITGSLVVLGAFWNSFLWRGFAGAAEDFGYVNKTPLKGDGLPPVFAYLISGSDGDKERILRLLKSVYHPRNRYLLYLDAGSSNYEREYLAFLVQSERTFRAFQNVDVIGRSYAVNKMGSSAVASVLHAAAIFLKANNDWDWFIALRASDYPIMTQDDLLHAFTFIPKDLNFIHYSNNTNWKQRRQVNQIVTDPNLLFQENTPIADSSDTRATPDAFKIFEGSPWMILTRDFMEYCVQGWDNLPRTLLMYFANSASPIESYFHTVLCNSDEFQNTTVNINLRYTMMNPKRQEPDELNVSHFKAISESGLAFAGSFTETNPVLQKLDKYILNRPSNKLVPGKWCSNTVDNGSVGNSSSKTKFYNCSSWGSINIVQPGDRGIKLGEFLSKFVAGEGLISGQCS
ncbi:hypothetical protein MKW98_007754 [Papaver atlanticum]|uniref:Uncharacterized protein n=1 Tax=Papaver atlanticum TaxID=357466 RepID=A0AAD4RYL8_9MAGN|nr:hypothetical protein MKW98_007754 [Papaver atlanticum]